MTTPTYQIPALRAGSSRDANDYNDIVRTLTALVAAVQGNSPGTGGGGGGTTPTPGIGPDALGCWDASINDCLAVGQPAILPAGVLPLRRPIVMPPGAILRGQMANEVATYLDSLYGSVLQPTAAWKQGDSPADAVIVCLDQAAGSYPATSEEQKGYGFMLDCHLLGGSGTDGIQLYGGVSRTHWERILVAQAPNVGFNATTGAGGSTGGAIRLNRVNVRYAGAAGFVLFKDSDVTADDCLAENCTGDGWTVTNLSNGWLSKIRSEHNGGNGLTYICTNSSTGSGVAKIDISTDRNEQNGIEIFSTNGSGVPVMLRGQLRRDGRNGGTGGGSFAGAYIHDYPGVVSMAGLGIFPGVSDSGTETNSPDIGLRIHGNSANGYVIGAACWFHGQNQGKADDGTSAAATFAASYKASGSTGSPTVTPA